MTYHSDFTLPAELLEQIAAQGLVTCPKNWVLRTFRATSGRMQTT